LEQSLLQGRMSEHAVAALWGQWGQIVMDDEDIEHRPQDATFPANDDQMRRPAPIAFTDCVVYIIPTPVDFLDPDPLLYFARCVWESFLDVEGDDEQLIPIISAGSPLAMSCSKTFQHCSFSLLY
jgi:hypothetical protein